MTRYTVVWSEDVEAAFIAAWVGSLPATRASLTETANWIDRELASNPSTKGRASSEFDTRVLIVPSTSTLAKIAVTYQVKPEDRVVRVVRLTFAINN